MEHIPFPFEMLIAQVPVSHQSQTATSKTRWKETVRDHARSRIAELTDWSYVEDGALAATLYYFPPARMKGDVDNIVKLIVDGMVGVVYRDDQVIERIVVQKFEPGTPWTFRNPTPTLSMALDAVPPVLYIRIDDDLNWRDVQ